MSHCWIGNRIVEGEGARHQVIAPWSGDLLTDFSFASEKQIDSAIESAVSCFSQLAHTPVFERQRWLLGIADRMELEAERFAQTISLEAAKPIRDARAEVTRAIATFRIAADEAMHYSEGEWKGLDQTPASVGRIAIMANYPRGVVLGITPFNFPLNLVAHKVAPAIAIGAPIILKPAPQTPSVALQLARIAAEAGVPEHALQVLPCEGATIEPFVSDPRIRHLTFTGSVGVGWKLFSLRLPTTPVTLELGGNAAVLIDETSDFDRALKRCLIGGYAYAGQICISVQRIYVTKDRYNEFLSEFTEGVSHLRVDDPLSEAADLACVIDDSAARRIGSWMDAAIALGAKRCIGGKIDGNRIQPAIFTHVAEECAIVADEVFGPVTVIEPVNDWQQGLDRIDRSQFGLQAGYFTTDSKRLMVAFDRLEVGAVIGNDVPTFRADAYPYGGVKQSGIGREGVKYAMAEMSEMKTLVFPPL